MRKRGGGGYILESAHRGERKRIDLCVFHENRWYSSRDLCVEGRMGRIGENNGHKDGAMSIHGGLFVLARERL